MKATLILAIAAVASAAHAQTWGFFNATGMSIYGMSWRSSGSLADIGVTDQRYLIVNASASGRPILNYWDTTAVLDDFGTLNLLQFYVEGHQASWPFPVELKLKNWETGLYDKIDTLYWGVYNQLSVTQLTGNLERYVSAGGLVTLQYRSQYQQADAHCLDMVRFGSNVNNSVAGKRRHNYPTSVLMNTGTFVSGGFQWDLRFADNQCVVADSQGSVLDWQCDFTGVTLPLSLRSLELTMRVGHSVKRVTNVWMYNFATNRWVAIPLPPYNDELNTWRMVVPNSLNPRQFVSAGGTARARFVITGKTRMSTDLMKLSSLSY